MTIYNSSNSTIASIHFCEFYQTALLCYFVTVGNAVSGALSVITNIILLIKAAIHCRQHLSMILLVNIAVTGIVTGTYQITHTILTQYGVNMNVTCVTVDFACVTSITGNMLSGIPLLTVTMMSVDRYCAVHHVVKSRTPSRKWLHYMLLICMAWLYSGTFCSIWRMGIVDTIIVCLYNFSLVIPCLGITVYCYMHILSSCVRSRDTITLLSTPSWSSVMDERRVTKLFAAISCVSILFIVPYIGFSILSQLEDEVWFFNLGRDFSHVISMCSCFLHPCLYWLIKYNVTSSCCR